MFKENNKPFASLSYFTTCIVHVLALLSYSSSDAGKNKTPLVSCSFSVHTLVRMRMACPHFVKGLYVCGLVCN